MAERLNIRFRPGSEKKPTPLSAQVQQIISQRGAFRDISESSLQADAEKLRPLSSDEDGATGSSETSEDEDPQAQRDKLWKNRNEMLQKLSYAQNEILSALDFVSLLLSNYTSAAQSTMSPALKELVPPESLDGRIVSNQLPTASQREQFIATSVGWKAESFEQASQKLESASSRLERQAERQSRYWRQVAHLQHLGWSVSRLPSDSRAIGVHFGSQESSPQFRAGGFTLLSQDDDGKVYLEMAARPRQASLLQVIIMRKGTQTGSYSFSSTEVLSSDAESQLISARDSLFNEELFYEISREARLIASQNVRTSPSTVEADINDDFQIKLVQCEVRVSGGDGSEDEDELAQLIASCFCFLLIAEHKRLHMRRTRRPLPIAVSRPPTNEYAILRPVLTQLRHGQRSIDVVNMGRSFAPSFKTAGIPISIECALSSPTSGTDQLDRFELLLERSTSEVSIKVQGQSQIIIALTTYLGSPLYGTTYEISAMDFGFVSLEAQRMDNINELRTSLTNLLELTLVHHVKTQVTSTNVKTPSKLDWTLAKPHTGEFLVSRANQNMAKVVIGLQSSCIALSSAQTLLDQNQKAKKCAYLWRANGLKKIPTDEVSPPDSSSLNQVLVQLAESFSE